MHTQDTPAGLPIPQVDKPSGPQRDRDLAAWPNVRPSCLGGRVPADADRVTPRGTASALSQERLRDIPGATVASFMAHGPW